MHSRPWRRRSAWRRSTRARVARSRSSLSCSASSVRAGARHRPGGSEGQRTQPQRVDLAARLEEQHPHGGPAARQARRVRPAAASVSPGTGWVAYPKNGYATGVLRRCGALRSGSRRRFSVARRGSFGGAVNNKGNEHILRTGSFDRLLRRCQSRHRRQ